MWKPSVAPSQSPQRPPHQPSATDPIIKPNVVTFPDVQPQAFIGKSICIKGEIAGAESLRIDGRVEGTVNLADSALHIGRDATVISKITARELVVCGTVQGNSTVGDRLEIRNGGSLIGNVTTNRISIEDGAHFKGSIDMRGIEHKSNGDESVQSFDKQELLPVSNGVSV
jgi:cytoskeletal protein CcmA (bactofilin family)